jgi:aminoglycoside phosphotransferase (APT) family kinase protein
MRDRAEDVAEHRPDARDALLALADRVDDALSGVPFGFGHGDFFCGNLLASGDRLTGVLDWDAAGPGRPPLIDLLHLRHEAAYPVPDHEWGASVVRRLLPWARSGGDDMARTYCRRVGFEPDPATLEALVLSYWLDRLDYQLRTHAHRSRHTEWLAGNIDDVVATSPLASGLGRSVAR